MKKRATIKDLFDLLRSDYWKNIQKEFHSLGPLTGEEHWFKALIHFKDYAYERNVSGAAARYREIAETALVDIPRGVPTSDLERKIWNTFQDECKKGRIKPNTIVDPLKPSEGEKQSLVRFVAEISDDYNETVAAWAFRMISQGNLKEAHERLKRTWGVGDKIASFYLRDIFWLGHNLDPKLTIEDDFLLQPVDIWVRRAAVALGHKQESNKSIAEYISSFEKENGLAHGGGNIGFWMLGGNYVRDEDQFKNVVESITKQGSDTSSALSIASRFETHGKFAVILRDLIL